MILRSPAFENGDVIPDRYTVDGDALTPPLEFRQVPSAAKSLALIMDDPDVPRSRRPDGVFDHWAIWNIASSCQGNAAGQAPPGVVGVNSAGEPAYFPPSPPWGRHRYFFRLYALDTQLDLPAGSTKQQLLRAMAGHVIAEAELLGVFR